MTIERDGDHRVIHCGSCPETLSTADIDDLSERPSFGEAWAAFQAAGWVGFQTGGKTADGRPAYDHLCPSCAED